MPKVGLIFNFQTKGLETWMASIPWTSVSFMFFFPSLAQLIAGYILKRNYRNICREDELVFIFHFCIYSGPIRLA